MELFNVALLGKWRWRLLTDERAEWFELMKILYGEKGILVSKQYSNWWKDLNLLDSCLNFAPN